MKRIAFIPVRGGSKSIKSKNIRPFCEKPLVYWVLHHLSQVEDISKIIIATDSDEIEATVLSFSFPRLEIYRRRPENAADQSSTESVMLEYLDQSNLDGEDQFMLVQATSPFTQAKHFQMGIDAMDMDSVDSVLSVSSSKRFYWDRDGTPINYDFYKRPRRQDFDGIWVENGAFYINTVEGIQRGKNRLGGQIAPIEMPEYTALELDEEDDWLIGEMLMRKHVLRSGTIPVEQIKLFITDVDGVLTDAGMYYAEDGNELKKFNTYDGKAIELMRNAGIKTAIITAEDTKIVENRARKLKIDHLFQGVQDKLSVARTLCEQEGLALSEVAFVGDDLGDLELLKQVAFAFCPGNAVAEIKAIPGIVKLGKKGGEGVLRELVTQHLFLKK